MASPESAVPWFGVAGASFAYGEHVVFTKLDFSLLPGESHALIGSHFEGKSTLCNLLSGRLEPDAGRIYALGTGYRFLTPGKARELGIFQISRLPQIYPRLTVLENLLSGRYDRWLGFLPFRRQRVRLSAWLGANGVDLPLNARMADLPRDLWVVVDILARLYVEPRLLILDEALEEVQQPWLGIILAVARRRLAEGMSLLWVTHKVEDALRMTDRITVMRGGKILHSDASVNLERLNLVRMCYAHLDDFDGAFDSREKFQELMRYTEAILRDLPAAVFILDPGGSVRFVNRAGRRLFDGERLAAARDDLFGAANSRLRELVLGDADSGQEVEYHGVPLMVGGRKLLADVRTQAILENGRKVGTMVIIEDVSLRENFRSRLILSERLASVGLLAAGVAHEVNNPLEVLGNCLNYLRDDPAAPDAPEVLTMMEEEVARIHQITNNLVAYSDGKPSIEAVDIMRLLRELAVLLSFQAEFRAVKLGIDGPEGEVLVTAASNELRQVFLNLFRNSLDAMPGGGRITVKVACVPDGSGAERVRVTVRDTGGGIQLDDPNDIFMPFVTTKKSGSPHQGLGLYIVYGILEKYGVSIEVENLLSGGCEFKLVFPAKHRG